ncbi:hypothetical protein K439DRAFT_1611125 [Ramaria rubella]|nr:hypothetical protein K439DRAFT_1611125 [Ramaria rubella]
MDSCGAGLAISGMLGSSAACLHLLDLCSGDKQGKMCVGGGGAHHQAGVGLKCVASGARHEGTGREALGSSPCLLGAKEQGWAHHQQGVWFESVALGARRQQTGREWVWLGSSSAECWAQVRVSCALTNRERDGCGQARHQWGVGLESMAPGARCQWTGREVGVVGLIISRALDSSIQPSAGSGCCLNVAQARVAMCDTASIACYELQVWKVCQ